MNIKILCQQTCLSSQFMQLKDLHFNGVSEFLSLINFLIHLVAMSMNLSLQSYFLHAKLLTVNWHDSGTLAMILSHHWANSFWGYKGLLELCWGCKGDCRNNQHHSYFLTMIHVITNK